ncbi:hypothetical protein ACQP2F_20325 [Actinoplanes sp. CA-030573]|uniref:hypothetical protein n=1 Tax=Actinoplanes sp. CA-030573 TaxID=3239898 RepID=UPI003D8FF6E0
MAEFFQVELDTLGQYVTTLQQAQQHLADLPRLLSGNDTQIGNGKLNDAAAEFQHSWEYGAKQLGELVGETTGAVRDVRQAYTGTDTAISDAVKTLGQPLAIINQAGAQLNHAG